jgi:hypothetical protein
MTRGVSKGLKRALITLIVLVVVLVAADYGAAAAAEYQVSKQLRTQLNLADNPAVAIHGFPFITQALGGDYHEIQVSAQGVPVKNTIRDLQIDATLREVRVGLGQLLSGSVRTIQIGKVDGQVQVHASDLGRLLGIPDLTIIPQSLDTIQGVGADQQQQQQMRRTGQTLTSTAGLELQGTVNIAGQKTQVTVYGLLSVANGSITVRPTKLQVANSLVSGTLPPALQQLVLGQFTHTFRPADLPLPFAVTPTGVQVVPGTLVVQGTAHNLAINTASVSS